MNIKKKLLLIVVLIGVCLGIGNHLSLKTILAHHTDLSETLFQYERYIAEERFDKASLLLSEHKEEISELIVNEVPEDLQNDFFSLLDENLSAASDESIDKQTKQNHALSLLLAIDSINNENSLIVKKWKSTLEDSISTILEGENVTDEQIRQITTNWDIMKLSMASILTDEEYTQLDKTYSNLAKVPTESNKSEQLEVTFSQMNETVISDVDNEEDGLTFTWMILIVGGFITLTLSYVGWQKYKGEKKKRQKQTLN
ncbi:hypothetical protein GH741_06935 [Aquibacillus halophilus]|uniref:Sporulation protein YpjB n=1 Tax=Aquibacillus halophilus TaxID=930132 RepID=A0A6A8DHN7_9BACI|nr:sporulation protein YpjB [Aquibacillus halophilus]MRH42417.1 hypothetical protein [Aquibacillus halophilus]